jgi:hypothetical protein
MASGIATIFPDRARRHLDAVMVFARVSRARRFNMTNLLSQCACGKLYISKNATISINDQTYNLHHGVDAMLESGQIFRTISDTISAQANNIVINIPIILDHQIKVVLKTQNNEIICVKYIGALGKRTALNNIYLSSEDLKIRGINGRILLSIYSVCNFITPECCGLLPSFDLTNTITSACVLIPPACDIQYTLSGCVSLTTSTTTLPPIN